MTCKASCGLDPNGGKKKLCIMFCIHDVTYKPYAFRFLHMGFMCSDNDTRSKKKHLSKVLGHARLTLASRCGQVTRI